MLTQWTIGNFKSIREPVTLELAPLTIFSGINSSGKSTFIQSILMLAQSFMSVVDDRALVLNGRFISLGDIDDILHHKHNHQPLTIGFRWMSPSRHQEPVADALSVRAVITRRQTISEDARHKAKAHPHVATTEVEFHPLAEDTRRSSPKYLSIEAVPAARLPGLSDASPIIQQRVAGGLYDFQARREFSRDFVRDTLSEQMVRVALMNIIPNRMLVSIDADLQSLKDDVDWLSDMLERIAQDPRSIPPVKTRQRLSPLMSELFKFIQVARYSENRPRRYADINDFRTYVIQAGDRLSPASVIGMLLRGRYDPKDMLSLQKQLPLAYTEFLRERERDRITPRRVLYEERLLPTDYRAAMDKIHTVMAENIYFLGPLRADPHPIYDAPPLSKRWSVGLKGEYTAAMLDEYRDRPITYPLPPDDAFSGTYRVKEGRLIDAVGLWLERMGLVENVETEETSKVGYRLTVQSPGLDMKLDLTSVGVGVSQILPTLVLALLAPADSTIIFEQPELHLHPKVQSVLADFFLGIGQLGKQCLVETHSEHLINRIRRRIVESDGREILDLTRIYFAEKEGAVTRYRAVEPNEYGAILDWPKGFFDIAENEASLILQKQLEKRRAARNRRNQQGGSDEPAH